MTKANDAEQEEEELDHFCPLFHKETQTAFFRAQLHVHREACAETGTEEWTVNATNIIFHLRFPE